MKLIILVVLVCGALMVVGLQLLQPESNPVGIVVPHHDMVAATRAAYFREVGSQVQPKTIVVVSPDHFNQAQSPIVVSDRVWETSAGVIEPNYELIDSLSIPIQNDPFVAEHGITSLLKEIKESFPDSTLVPILLSRSATFASMIDLTTALYQHCPDCLLVASVDFSHTTDAMVADLHDVIAVRGLQALDAELLYKEAEVDSPEALVVLTTWAKLHEHSLFELFSHTNSGFLAGVPSGEMTTHIIGGYTAGEMEFAPDTVTFMLAGDMLLSRGVATRLAQQPNLFEKLGERFFWGVDMSVVNLEGYFTSEPTAPVETNGIPLFPIPAQYITYLDYLRPTVVHVANNHALDGGEAGLVTTLALLSEYKLAVIGDKPDLMESRVAIERVGAVSVAIVGVYTHQPFNNLIEKITQLSDEGHHVVVYAHWGEEYSSQSNEVQQRMARDWIDAGADLVVGSHPHVVQEVAVYKDRPIVYSLGNFVFDQNFSEDVQVGAVLGGVFAVDSVSLFLTPVHTYLEPFVLSAPEYTTYVESWTTHWAPFAVGDGYFRFEFDQQY